MTSAGAKAGAATNSRVGLLLREESLFKGTDTVERRDEPNKLAAKPKEGLLEVVVGLCRYVVILQIFLSVERNSFGLYLSLLHINLISGKDDRDVLAYTDQITC